MSKTVPGSPKCPKEDRQGDVTQGRVSTNGIPC